MSLHSKMSIINPQENSMLKLLKQYPTFTDAEMMGIILQEQKNYINTSSLPQNISCELSIDILRKLYYFCLENIKQTLYPFNYLATVKRIYEELEKANFWKRYIWMNCFILYNKSNLEPEEIPLASKGIESFPKEEFESEEFTKIYECLLEIALSVKPTILSPSIIDDNSFVRALCYTHHLYSYFSNYLELLAIKDLVKNNLLSVEDNNFLDINNCYIASIRHPKYDRICNDYFSRIEKERLIRPYFF